MRYRSQAQEEYITTSWALILDSRKTKVYGYKIRARPCPSSDYSTSLSPTEGVHASVQRAETLSQICPLLQAAWKIAPALLGPALQHGPALPPPTEAVEMELQRGPPMKTAFKLGSLMKGHQLLPLAIARVDRASLEGCSGFS